MKTLKETLKETLTEIENSSPHSILEFKLLNENFKRTEFKEKVKRICQYGMGNVK